MIIGIGVDQVATQRFLQWSTKSNMQLEKILSKQEINYCLSTPSEQQQAERFAARFAAREAFFKAYTAAVGVLGIATPASFMAILPHVEVVRDTSGVPLLYVNWKELLAASTAIPPHIHLSLSHTADLAIAFVILEQRSSQTIG